MNYPMNKLNQKISENKWTDYHLDHIIPLSPQALDSLLYKFEEEIARPLLKKNKQIKIICQLNLLIEDLTIKSLSPIQIIELSKILDLKSVFYNFIEIHNNKYYDIISKALILRYKLSEKILPTTIQQNIISSHPYKNNINLPMTMNLYTWNFNLTFIQKNIATFYDHKYIYIFQLYLTKENNISYLGYKGWIKDKFNNSIILTFQDQLQCKFNLNINKESLIEIYHKYLNKENLNTFTRSSENKTFHYINNHLVKNLSEKPGSLMKKIIKEKVYNNKIITMDIETMEIKILSQENKDKKLLIPILNGIYDGQNYYSFYIEHGQNLIKNSENMIKKSLQFLLKSQYHDHHVYIHNFSYFDGIFLLKHICNLSNNIQFKIKDNRFIQITVLFIIENKEYKIQFKDSLLLLPASLKNLAKSFNTDKKTEFHFNQLNLESIFHTPIKKELIDYNKKDCIILFNILSKFSLDIFNRFKLNIRNYPTLSSLAFGIFRSHYLKKDQISITNIKIYDELKSSFYGGHVDVYRPHGFNIYRYDVNSLYPYVMKNYFMPIGHPTYFEGDIDIKNIFGFLYVNIQAPDIFIPILPIKFKNKTVFPKGKWSGWYFSEELKFAISLGYHIQVKKGYLFEKGIIFHKYVNDLYKIKANSIKDSPEYLISKLLLNSLYGRFGMSPYLEKYVLVNKPIDDTMYIKALNMINLEDKELIAYSDPKNINHYELNISLPIAAAITAYARIFMNKIKIEYQDHLYYSDTDSIDLDIPLPKNKIGPKLGQFKLEYIFKEAVYLAPKVYGGILENNKEFIKIKGSKVKIGFKEMKSLLIKDHILSINQNKWYKQIETSNIFIKDTIYTLTMNESKRSILFKDGIFSHTKPMNISY